MNETLSADHDRFALSWRDLTLIAAFWATFATLLVVGRLVDRPFGAAPPVTAAIGVALLDAACWTVLTPGIFLLAAHVLAERRPLVRLLLMAGGIVAALLIGRLLGEWRRSLVPLLVPPMGPTGVGMGDALGTSWPAPPRSGRLPRPMLWVDVVSGLVFYLGILSAGFARVYSRRYQARREEAARREAVLQAQLAEARVESLRRQLDPHFLFNTLNAVSALVDHDPPGVRRMLARLGDLLRHSFEHGGDAEVTLRDELATLRRYVEIMEVRFQGRLTFEARPDEDTLDALVPNMILQPLVENAVKHGVERTTGACRVVVESGVEADALVLRVRDEGPGAGAHGTAGPDAPYVPYVRVTSTAGVEERRGVGLRNTRARLEQLYGAHQGLTLATETRRGTVATVRLPFHERLVETAARETLGV